MASVAEGGAEDVDRAVKAARAAFQDGAWSSLHPAERGRLLYKLARLVEEHAQELAEIDAVDAGKPVTNSLRVDLPAAVDCFEYYAGWADKIHGETVPVSGAAFTYLLRQPVGVVGQIIPWNFPRDDGGLEAGAGAGLRLHGRPQARGAVAAFRAAAGRALP